MYKVLLLKTDDGTISLHVIDEALADIHQAEIDGLDFKTTVTIKISIDVDNENKLTLNAGGVGKATDLVANLKTEMAGLKIGGPQNNNNDFGPLISAEHKAKVISLIESAVEEGAQIVVDGRSPDLGADSQGFFFGRNTD